MPTRRKHVALSTSLPRGSAPPREFLIWSLGSVETTKGTFLFDQAAARSVMSAYQAYGNRLTIDYEHKAVDPNRRAGDGKAAGSFELELRADGLYAVDVRWTPPASEALSNKEWLYFSPYFSAEEDSGRILELINLALTNIPATMHLQPLVAAQRSVSFMDKTDDKDRTTGAPKDADVEADRKATEAARKSARDRLAKARAELNAAKAECAAFDDKEPKDEDDDDDREKEEEVSPPSSGDPDDDSDNEDEEPEGARHEDDELAATPPEDDDDDKRSSKRAAAPPSAASVSAARRPAVRGRPSCIEAAARALTGKTNEGEIIGALTALADATRTNVSLSKRIGDLESKLRRSDVESMVTRAIKSGKLTPAEREWAFSYGMESPSKLRGYLDVTPARANVAGSEYREPPVRPGEGGRGPTLAVALSAEERKICENTGVDPEKFAAVKHRPIRVG